MYLIIMLLLKICPVIHLYIAKMYRGGLCIFLRHVQKANYSINYYKLFHQHANLVHNILENVI